jgi:hypothetical protein
MRAVDVIIGGVLGAGFTGAAAAHTYRAVGDFCLYWAGGEAAFLALDEQAQKIDRAAWTRAHLAVDQAEYPHIWQIRQELPEVGDDEIFENVLALVMAGMMQRAPRPCQCPRHALAGSGQRG